MVAEWGKRPELGGGKAGKGGAKVSWVEKEGNPCLGSLVKGVGWGGTEPVGSWAGQGWQRRVEPGKEAEWSQGLALGRAGPRQTEY